nr:reverse transcriptase domain-containing protein [Tanacetum cinerariifolium]
MSTMANTTPIVTTVTKTKTKEKTPNGAETAPRVNILDFCEEHYEDILPVMDKIRRDKRREVHTRLDFGESSRKSQRMREDSQNSSAKTLSARYRNPSERPQIRDRLRNNDGNVFSRLGHRRESAFKRLSDTYSPSTTKFGPDGEYSRDDSYSRGRPHKRNFSPSRDRPRSRGRSHGIEESYSNTYSSGDKYRYHSHGTGRSSSIKRGRNSESSLFRLSEIGTCEGGY